jgi:hypothetical protein
MKKCLLLMYLVIFTQLLPSVNHPSILAIKKEVEQKKSHPDLVFMGKILMIVGGAGTVCCSIVLTDPQGNMEREQYNNFLKKNYHRLECFYGTFIAGAIGYFIGTIKYNQTNSSLKNLFSRAALAQKIFNI